MVFKFRRLDDISKIVSVDREEKRIKNWNIKYFNIESLGDEEEWLKDLEKEKLMR